MARRVVQLLVLLLAIPAQYFISIWWSQNPDGTSIKVQNMISGFRSFYQTWLNPTKIYENLKKYWSHLIDDHGHCVAVEVMKYRSDVGHFANSPKPRYQRPSNVRYRVGQVFLHKSEGYHGVIIGWDDHARAPDVWLNEHYGNIQGKNLEPHYAVLPDAYESPLVRHYVSQDDIEIVSNRKIVNDVLDDYFEAFDGVIYLPRPFLKLLYPKD